MLFLFETESFGKKAWKDYTMQIIFKDYISSYKGFSEEFKNINHF